MENIIVSKEECAVDFRDAYSARKMAEFLGETITDKNYVVLCVGSDKALDDCLGPLCGSLLENKIVLPVIGTLTSPVHASNISFTLDKISLLYPDRKLIVVDAAHSGMYRRGNIVAFTRGLELTDCDGKIISVGDISLAGITRDERAENTVSICGLADISAMAIACAAAIRLIFG